MGVDPAGYRNTKIARRLRSRRERDEFMVLQPHLAWNSGEASYAELAGALNTTEGNVKVKVHRLRQKLRVILETEAEKGLGPRWVPGWLRSFANFLSHRLRSSV